MDLPALLPEKLYFTRGIRDDDALLSLLIKNPPDFIDFFEFACGDETWSEAHQVFTQKALTWLTEEFFWDRLLMEFAEKAAHSIRQHIHILDPFLPKNLTLVVEREKVEVNSLLWGTGSESLRTLIRRECRDKNVTVLPLEDIEKFTFIQIAEFLKTNQVKQLWKKEKPEVIRILHQATEYRLTGLMMLCEDILKRYIEKANVVEMLLKAHKESWLYLKEECINYFNHLDVGIKFEMAQPPIFIIEFIDFREMAIEIFDKVCCDVTHLIFSNHLTEHASFSEIINRCPSLICLDISRSRMFSDRLFDIPEDLQELNVSKCSWLTNKNLPKLLALCPNINKISLASNVQLGYPGWGALRKLPRLVSLDISCCHQVTDQDFKVILRASPKVKSFNMEECQALSDEAIYELIRSHSHVTDVNLSRCQITDAALVELAVNCKSLTNLNLTRCLGITEKGILKTVRYAKALQEIDLSKCKIPNVTFDAIRQITPFLKVRRTP